MATTTTLRPEMSGPTDAPPAPTITEGDLALFVAGRPPEDHTVDLLAFALAAEKRQAPTPEAVERLRQEATAALSEYTFRYLHNSIERIRREAVAEQLGRIGRPPGFGTLLLANLAALLIAGLVAYGLARHPATFAGLTGLLSG